MATAVAEQQKDDGDDDEMDNETVRLVFVKARSLCSDIGQIREILDILTARSVLSADDDERVMAQETTMDQCRQMFKILSVRGAKGFQAFLIALYQVKLHHIRGQMEEFSRQAKDMAIKGDIDTKLRCFFQVNSDGRLAMEDIKKRITASLPSKEYLLQQLTDMQWEDLIMAHFPTISATVEGTNRYYSLEDVQETSPTEATATINEELQSTPEHTEGGAITHSNFAGRPETWDKATVQKWLASIGCDSEVIKTFNDHKIHGRAMMQLNNDDFREMKVCIGDRKVIMEEINAMKKLPVEPKHDDRTSLTTSAVDEQLPSRADEENSVPIMQDAICEQSYEHEEQIPRKFGCGANMKYYLGRVIRTDLDYSFMDSTHLFCNEDLEQSVLLFVKFVASCLNDRKNGIFHMGISTRCSDGAECGLVTGVELKKEKVAYQDFFQKALTNCFYDDQVRQVKECVSHIHFIPVVGQQKQNSLFVLEVDIEASYTVCHDEAFFVKLPSAFGHMKAKKEYKGVLLFRLSNEGSGVVQEKKVSEFMKIKAQLAKRREELEENVKRKKRGPLPDLRQRFVTLFANNEKILSGDMYSILVLNKPNGTIDKESFEKCFSFIPVMDWKVIFDFDDEAILCEHSQLDMGMKVTMASAFDAKSRENVGNPDNLKLLHEDIKTSTVPHWVFMNGHKPTLRDPRNLFDWKKYSKQHFKEVVRFFEREIPHGRALVVFALLSNENDIMLEAAEEMITAFPDQWLVVSDNFDIANPWMTELSRRGTVQSPDERAVVGIPWDHLQDIVRELKGFRKTGTCYVVTSSGSSAELDLRKKQKLVDLDILSMYECDHDEFGNDQDNIENHRREVADQFYKGSEAVWWNFFFQNQVCKRDIHDELKFKVHKALSSDALEERVGRVLLYHQPGAGGTTTAKHILWSFRKTHRCAIIKSITEETVRQVLEFFSFAENSSPKPVLLLLDNLEEEKVQLLYAELQETAKQIIRESSPSSRILCVFLVCLRKMQMERNAFESKIHLRHDLSQKEINWFKVKYTELEQRSSTDHSFNPKLLISFNVMKENFKEASLSKIVKETLQELCDKKERRFLKYVSLINAFDIHSRALPTSAFDMLMIDLPYLRGPRFGRKAIDNRWETHLSSALRMLINESTRQAMGHIHAIKIAHPLLSKIILQQLCTSDDRRELLSDVTNEFLNCREVFVTAGIARDNLVKIVLDIMKQRNKRVDGAPETDFAPLIQQIADNENKQKASEILVKGLDLSNDPFVAQQLSRLYISMQEWAKAEEYAKQATTLRPECSFLWDTYGRIFEKQLNEAYKKLVHDSSSIEVEELKDHLRLAQRGLQLFRTVQATSEQERGIYSNNAGYEGELRIVVCLLQCLNFAAPFYGNLPELQRFLMHDGYVPKSVSIFGDVDGEDYIEMVKRLHTNTKMVLTRVDDEMIQLREEYVDDSKGTLQRRRMDSWDRLKSDLNFFFGEGTDQLQHGLEARESYEYRRRRMFSLVGPSMRGIFERRRKVDGVAAVEKVREYAELNLASDFASADDTQTLICANLSLLTDETYLTRVKYNDMVVLSKQLYQKRSTRKSIHLEPFLFYVMFNWPRKSVQTFIRRQELEDAIRRWKDAYYQKYPRQREEGKPYRKKDTTMFFLANGSDMNSICSHEQLMASQEQKIRNDAFWRSPFVLRTLQRFKGTLNSDGSLVAVDLEFPTGGRTQSSQKEQISIPTSFPIRDRSRWNKQVFLVIGFAWVGPKAYDVTLNDPTEDVQYMTYDETTTLPKHLKAGHSMSFKSSSTRTKSAIEELQQIQVELSQIRGLKVKEMRGERLTRNEESLVRKERSLNRRKEKLINRRMQEYDDVFRD